MEKSEIDKDMEILLKELLDKKEFETLKKIVESSGKFSLQEVD